MKFRVENVLFCPELGLGRKRVFCLELYTCVCCYFIIYVTDFDHFVVEIYVKI